MQIAAQVQALQQCGTGELRRKYRELFGEDARSWNRSYLLRRIAWRLQEMAHGGLSERACQRLSELVDESLVRTRPTQEFSQTVNAVIAESRPASSTTNKATIGTIYRRVYKGREIVAQVVDNGVLCDGTVYPSLTALAHALTGGHCSGPAFFKRGTREGQR
jgi:hypothetical protein